MTAKPLLHERLFVPEPEAPLHSLFSVSDMEGHIVLYWWETPDSAHFDYMLMARSPTFRRRRGVRAERKSRDFYAFRRDWLRRAATSARNIILMTVRDSSMEGDVVMLDLGRRRIYNGSIYAVGMNETILLKKLEPLPGDKVRVTNDNRDEYPPYVADAAAVRIIGQVIWYARHLMRGE